MQAQPSAVHLLHAIFILSVRVLNTSHAHAGDYTLPGAASSGSLIGKRIEGANHFASLLTATCIAAAARCRGACRAVPAEQAVVAPQRGKVLQSVTAGSESAAAAADAA